MASDRVRSIRYSIARTVAAGSGYLYRIRGLAQVLDLASLGRLERSYGRVPQLSSVEAVFAHMAEHLEPGRLYNYLEFGVYQGRSLQWWSTHLTGPNHRLVGFDSFEGLPQTWNADNPDGHFDLDGSPPTIHDPRVRFVIGWFDDTVPKFSKPESGSLIVNIDCDLYSSTKEVLDNTSSRILPGSVLVFDDFFNTNL